MQYSCTELTCLLVQFGGVIRSTVQAKLMIPFISVTKLIKKVEPDDVESGSTSDSVAGEEEIQETKQHNNPRPRKVRPILLCQGVCIFTISVH